MTFWLGLGLGLLGGGMFGAIIMAFFVAVGQVNHHYEN